MIKKNTTKRTDRMYKSYCRNDNVSCLKVLENISENGVFDTDIFNDIGKFSETILSEFKKLHDERTNNNNSPNDPRPYLEIIPGSKKKGSTKGIKRNTKYIPLNPICKNDQKDEDDKPIKCFRWYDTQPLEKHFIPQLYHIVLDFGILRPLGINNIKHIRLETEGIINPFAIQKFEQFNLKTGETKTPQQHISEELDNWCVDFTHRVEIREALFNNSPIPHQIPNQASNCVKEKFINVLLSYHQFGFTPNNITSILRRFDTVCRLRLFDLFVCNSYNIPENQGNLEHSIVYLDTIELKEKFEKKIRSRNAFSHINREKKVKIPKLDNILSEFIQMELVLKTPRTWTN